MNFKYLKIKRNYLNLLTDYFARLFKTIQLSMILIPPGMTIQLEILNNTVYSLKMEK